MAYFFKCSFSLVLNYSILSGGGKIVKVQYSVDHASYLK